MLNRMREDEVEKAKQEAAAKAKKDAEMQRMRCRQCGKQCGDHCLSTQEGMGK